MIRESVISKGMGKGATMIDVDNGRLRFCVLPDFGMDILDLGHGGVNMSFVSKNGLNGNKNLPFSKAFCGGFLYTCGLEAIGNQEGYPMHGSIHNTAAANYRYIEDGGKIAVEGEMLDTALFGRNLVLNRRIETAIGSESLTISDTVENRGAKDDTFITLYHFNLGSPMIDDGTYIEAAIESTAGMTAAAAERTDTALQMSAPVEPVELVYCHALKTKQAEIKVVNKKVGKQVTFAYDTATLPCFMEWKSMVAGDYALGIEPTTSSLIGERRYRTLKPQERAEFAFTITVSAAR
jgi:hypothetical protein